MSDNSSSGVISLPQGGGALSGIGEKFSPDLFTGTGNFTVPLALPQGRNGFQPQINLVYSTGNGNGPFGLGWNLGIPGVSRKVSDGVPLYNEAEQKLREGKRRDVFILSGEEDLVPVDGGYPGTVTYRPRTEGLFAQIERHLVGGDDFWRVKSKDGLVSVYGTPKPEDPPADWFDTAVIKRPDTDDIFAWKLTETKDPFGNLIRYDYGRDRGDANGRRWDQPLLRRIRYVDYGDPADNLFLVHVDFVYEADERPDPFSDYRAGFEIRGTKRCRSIKVSTHTADGKLHNVREYRFAYESDPNNGVSLLRQMDIIGYDDEGEGAPYQDDDPQSAYAKQLPPLTFGYTRFAPEKRRFEMVSGRDLPVRALGAPDMELVDLHGGGLPDILEMNGVVRYWRNLGDGRFDMPRPLLEAPPHALNDPGVQMLDANGDGRTDLLVTQGALTGYYPLQFGGLWSRRSFSKHQYAPSFDLKDPEVRLMDLTGDGVTDVLRSGTRLECFFNDPHKGWLPDNTRWVERRPPEDFPDVSFSDPRVRLADMTGDGLQDIVLVHDGNVEYWPNLGHGDWGKRLSMRRSPRLPDGYEPQHILVGDVDGDGLADIVYVDDDKVMLWLNHSGNGWSAEPVVIPGSPPGASTDHLRLVDLLGAGVGGVLWSADATSLRRAHLMFLDFTGGVKPYVLNEMDNHMGAVTRVEYRPSTHYYLEDQKRPDTRWRTPLPFPVQVVAKVEAIDEISRGKLTTEYRYHHGYWDGAEREFRGFGMVEQFDTEAFDDYHGPGLHGNVDGFTDIPPKYFSAPTLTKTWFHQGPVGEEFGDWAETDYTGEYWRGDPQLLGQTEQVNAFLKRFNDQPGSMPSPGNRRIKRDALRTLRGSILRSELYAPDGDNRPVDGEEMQRRPYTVSEHAYSLEEIAPPAAGLDRKRVFFPHSVSQRTTQWERGDDPMTQFSFTDHRDENDDFDRFGRPRRQTAAAMPRLKRHRADIAGALVAPFNPNETRVLATHTRTFYTETSIDPYINDRVAQVKTYELANPGVAVDEHPDSPSTALRDICERFESLTAADVNLIGHQLNHYDGPDYEGRPVGEIGPHGALIRTENLVFTDDILHAGYSKDNDYDRRPDYLDGSATLPATPPNFDRSLGYRKQPRTPGGYEAGYYADTQRRKLSPRGMLSGIQDALKHETLIEYENILTQELLPAKVIDAGRLETSADYNYRLLQPRRLTEPNGNSTCLTYSPVGLPLKQFVVGRNETLGGTEGKPELSFAYKFLNFERHRAGGEATLHPVFVHTTRRIHHARDDASDDAIETREYSDGYGRLIQTQAQAAERVFGATGDDVGLPAQGDLGPELATAQSAADRVVVSGWQVFNNKGKVVEKYEPFFSRGWDFQPRGEAVGTRVHATLFYDPRGQVVRTQNPDGSEQRVIFGAPGDRARLEIAANDPAAVPAGFRPTPWERYSFDANDLACVTMTPDGALLDSRAPDTHHFTPASVLLDGLGRERVAVIRNGVDPTEDWYITRSDFDIRGNLLVVRDALGREAFRYHYDLLNRTLAVKSVDAGARTSVFDAQGNLIDYRDSKGGLILRTYDDLNRPRELRARDESAGAFTLRERIHYGDDAEDHEEARTHNTLGRPVKHFDEAGLLETPEYDFKGNLLEKRRRTIRDDLLPDWQADWPVTDAENDLDPTVYETSIRYDALNRPVRVTHPQDVEGVRQQLTPRYNRAGALEGVQLEDETYVEHIAYNAKGQRVLIAYGNGVMTRYAYDPLTFRLARLRTERFTHPNNVPPVFQPNGEPHQDFTYSYDLAGNVTTIDERTRNCGFVNAPRSQGRNRLTREFTYDPIYRLLSATGRACPPSPSQRSPDDEAPCGFYAGGTPNTTQDNAPELTAGYAERYTYDPAGNMRELWRQVGATPAATRVFGMGGLPHDQWRQAPNNRLTSSMNGTINAYRFDNNGNLTTQNTERHHAWDYADRMIGYRVQPNANSPASISVRYLYGADGMRVKKWVRNQQEQVNTTVYVDGAFEHHRRITTTATTENNTLHVTDNRSRIALVRVGAPLDDRDAAPLVSYHLGDHLGSSAVVLGGNNSAGSTFINREEYFPYGETSFGSFARKRYRYSGKERDEESGMYYYGARYFAPWIARWMSCDPRGRVNGLNLFVFVSNNPKNYVDPRGTEEAVPPVTLTHRPKTTPIHCHSTVTANPAAQSEPDVKLDEGSMLLLPLEYAGKEKITTNSVPDSLGDSGVPPAYWPGLQKGLDRLKSRAEDPAANKWLKERVETTLGPKFKEFYGKELKLPDLPIAVIYLKARFNLAEAVNDPELSEEITQQRLDAEAMAAASPDQNPKDFLVMGFAKTGEPDIYLRKEALTLDSGDDLLRLDQTILHEGLHTLGVPGADLPEGGGFEISLNFIVGEFTQRFPLDEK